MTALVYLADFILGLFLGVLALASFSPAQLARQVYQRAWYVFGAFIVVAYFTIGPKSKSLLRADLPSTTGLGATVLIGIALAFIVGLIYTRRLASEMGEGDSEET